MRAESKIISAGFSFSDYSIDFFQEVTKTMFKTFAVLMLLLITLAVLRIEGRNVHGVRILALLKI